jgi:hypothetical protein
MLHTPARGSEERAALATDTHATMEGTVVFYGVCSEATVVRSQEVYSLGSDPRLYNSDTGAVTSDTIPWVSQLQFSVVRL